MRHFARTSLGMLALGLIAPITVSAQTYESSSPAGYLPASAVPSTPSAPVGPGGRPMPAPASAPAAPVHNHVGRKVCAACAAKQANNLPPGQTIVRCSHLKNGVCKPCQEALAMPGTFVQAGAPAAAAPGRAMASSGTPAQVPGGYDPSMSDPAPVGVVQAGFSQPSGMMGMPAQAPMAAGMQANAPGRAMAESAPGNDPYQKKSGAFPHPHILGHLFGWSGIGAERREEKAWKKSEAHAMITYDPNTPTGVSELPASAVFGKQK